MSNISQLKQVGKSILSLALIASALYIGHGVFRVTSSRHIGFGTFNTTASVNQIAAQPSQSVASFIGSEGVNIHTTYTATPYQVANDTLTALQMLGIGNVRDNPAVSQGSTEINTLTGLQNSGIKFNFTIGSADTSRVSPFVATIAQRYAAGTIGIEGPNELDLFGDSNWPTDDRTVQTQLYNTVRANSGLASANVVGPSLSGIKDTADSPTLGDLSAYLNIGNIHSYPANGTPTSTISAHLHAITAVAGSKPVWTTETGYNQCTNCTTGNPPIGVDQTTQAILDPEIYAANFQAGVAKTFIYELFDEGTDASNYQKQWGLFNYTTTSAVSAKPSGQAIANMNAVLNQGGTGTAQQNTLAYTLSGDGNLQHLLLSKHTASGDHYELMVWENQSPWNFKTETPVQVAPQPISLTFGQAVTAVKYTPSSQASAATTYATVSQLNDTAGPAITIYDIALAPPSTSSSGSSSSSSNAGGTSNSTGNTSATSSSASKPVHSAVLAAIGSAAHPVAASSVVLMPSGNIAHISKVVYYVDGKKLTTVTKAPFTYHLTAKTLSDGCHAIQALTYNKDGSTAKSSRQVCITSKKQSLASWLLLVACIVIILLVIFEFGPFYPYSKHYVSRGIRSLWRRIYKPKNTTTQPPISSF